MRKILLLILLCAGLCITARAQNTVGQMTKPGTSPGQKVSVYSDAPLTEATGNLILNALSGGSGTATPTTTNVQTPVLATSSGSLAAGSRGPTFIFSADWVGTFQGSASGVVKAGATYSPPVQAGTILGQINYTITAGSITILDVR